MYEDLFPTRVGVYLMEIDHLYRYAAFFHASGSVPLSIAMIWSDSHFFPHTWECTSI